MKDPARCLRVGPTWAEWAASLPARQTHHRYWTLWPPLNCTCEALEPMESAQGPDEPSLPSLPEDLLNNIGILLDDQDVCMLELASKSLHRTLSRPSPSELCEGLLDLNLNHRVGPCSSDASRWSFQLRSFS